VTTATVNGSGTRRAELAAFLRSRRGRISPEDAGPPPGPAGTRMIVYTPADEPTRRAVASLIAGEGAAAQFPCWPAHDGR
jgi:hypothetical protein